MTSRSIPGWTRTPQRWVDRSEIPGGTELLLAHIASHNTVYGLARLMPRREEPHHWSSQRLTRLIVGVVECDSRAAETSTGWPRGVRYAVLRMYKLPPGFLTQSGIFSAKNFPNARTAWLPKRYISQALLYERKALRT